MWSQAFWKATAERAVKTFAWSLGASLGTGGVGLLSMPWAGALSIAGSAAVLSVLGSIGSAKATGGGPSLTNAESLPGAGD